MTLTAPSRRHQVRHVKTGQVTLNAGLAVP